MNKEKCSQCSKEMLSMQSINTEINGKQVVLCGTCWNKFISKRMGLNFETMELNPMSFIDCKGKMHEFHFLTHLVPSGLAIDACELINGEIKGYKFSVFGPFDCDQTKLISNLFEKIKRGLSIKYLKNDNNEKYIKDKSVAGIIEWDADFGGDVPELYIDGEKITWAEFGKMLMTFEGWQFKLDIFDRSEDINSATRKLFDQNSKETDTHFS